MPTSRTQAAAGVFRELQATICAGQTRVLQGGAVFEKAGVNFSLIHGPLSADLAVHLPGEAHDFEATGISLVIHPRNPMVPTVHANWRYLARGDRDWFGGGADLTPFYPYRADIIHFHRTWRDVCRRHAHLVDYQRLKEACDEYFWLPHRNEARGVGGIFFDYLEGEWDTRFAFVREAGDAFLDAYRPIVERRKG